VTECGQTLHANFGSIEYKLDEFYGEGELCVFILRHNYRNSSGFRFELETHGFPEYAHNPIHINTYRDTDTSFRETIYLGPPKLVQVANVKGSVAVVIFKPFTPHNNSGTGFKLNFKALGTPENGDDYVGVNQAVFNDESKSPIQLSLTSNCTGSSCIDVYAITSEAKLVTDPAFYFTLSLSLYSPQCYQFNVDVIQEEETDGDYG